MTRKNFILGQLARTNRKYFENYVITRIIHGVNDPEVKYITQQYMKRPNGYALVDLYLPQLRMYVEVNELRHQYPECVVSDAIRRADIVSSTGLTEHVIEEDQDLTMVNAAVDQLVHTIQEEIRNTRQKGTFRPWNPELDSLPEQYIKMGYIDATDDVSFRTHADACNCLGHNYRAHCSGGARHPYEPDVLIWFPKLYRNDRWENSISDDNQTIQEREMHNETYAIEFLSNLIDSDKKRIVFAHVIGPMGKVRYRFKGLYQLNSERTKLTGYVTYERIDTRVKTYPQKKQ